MATVQSLSDGVETDHLFDVVIVDNFHLPRRFIKTSLALKDAIPMAAGWNDPHEAEYGFAVVVPAGAVELVSVEETLRAVLELTCMDHAYMVSVKPVKEKRFKIGTGNQRRNSKKAASVPK